ncbi:MAG: hypothetical protein ABSB89_02165 [Candidatus Bathyarchaeia archaeon]|jgi:hypothetical protein
MKSRLVVSIVISILIASGLAASYTGYTTVLAKPTHGFTLIVSGTAYDPQKHIYVNVALNVTGTAAGKMNTNIDLYVKGGDVSVNHGYGTFSVSHGCGELVSSCHFIALYIWLTPKYGGQVAFWCMSGRTGKLSDQTLQVSLGTNHVILPMTGCPRLDDLDMQGTIAPVY